MGRMILIPKHRKQSMSKGVHKRSHRKDNENHACRVQSAYRNTVSRSRSGSVTVGNRLLETDSRRSTDASLFGED